METLDDDLRRLNSLYSDLQISSKTKSNQNKEAYLESKGNPYFLEEELNKNQDRFFLLKRELKEKENEIKHLQALVEEKSEKINKLTINNDINWENKFCADKRMKQKDEEISKLKKGIEEVFK